LRRHRRHPNWPVVANLESLEADIAGRKLHGLGQGIIAPVQHRPPFCLRRESHVGVRSSAAGQIECFVVNTIHDNHRVSRVHNTCGFSDGLKRRGRCARIRIRAARRHVTRRLAVGLQGHQFKGREQNDLCARASRKIMTSHVRSWRLLLIVRTLSIRIRHHHRDVFVPLRQQCTKPVYRDAIALRRFYMERSLLTGQSSLMKDKHSSSGK